MSNSKGGVTKKSGYSSYVNMKTRCNSESCSIFYRYGGRGIKVCDRWMGADGSVNFFEDMGERPSKEHSIDRIDNDGDYTPENCRWANKYTQISNKGNNTKFTGVNKASKSLRYKGWIAFLIVDRKRYSKYFKNYEDAVRYRLGLEIEHLGYNVERNLKTGENHVSGGA